MLQVYEMFVAGYQFQVLSPIFTCHWGLQNKKSRPAWRERQNSVNRRHFDVFKREVFARYHKDPLRMLQPRKNQKPPPAKGWKPAPVDCSYKIFGWRVVRWGCGNSWMHDTVFYLLSIGYFGVCVAGVMFCVRKFDVF